MVLNKFIKRELPKSSDFISEINENSSVLSVLTRQNQTPPICHFSFHRREILVLFYQIQFWFIFLGQKHESVPKLFP